MAPLDVLQLAVAFRVPRSRTTLRRYLQLALLFLLVLPTWTKREKRNKFLENIPILAKAGLFWWCLTVFVIMMTFIVDSMCWRYLGAAHIKWSTSFKFDGRASREEYWKQFVDPSSWSSEHPIFQSADVRMVRVLRPDAATSDGLKEDSVNADEKLSEAVPEAKLLTDEIQAANGIRSEPSKRMQTIDFAPLKAGLGLVLHHKASTEQRSGLFYCSRECTLSETPEEGAWQFMMKTVEVGVGHMFLPGSEEVKVTLLPPEEDGSVLCDMEGTGAVQSRIFRWWYKLSATSAESAKAMLEMFNEQLGHAKKAE